MMMQKTHLLMRMCRPSGKNRNKSMHMRTISENNRTTNTISLDKEYIGLLTNVFMKVAKTILEGLDAQQTQVANKVVEHLNAKRPSLK